MGALVDKTLDNGDAATAAAFLGMAIDAVNKKHVIFGWNFTGIQPRKRTQRGWRGVYIFDHAVLP